MSFIDNGFESMPPFFFLPADMARIQKVTKCVSSHLKFCSLVKSLFSSGYFQQLPGDAEVGVSHLLLPSLRGTCG